MNRLISAFGLILLFLTVINITKGVGNGMTDNQPSAVNDSSNIVISDNQRKEKLREAIAQLGTRNDNSSSNASRLLMQRVNKEKGGEIKLDAIACPPCLQCFFSRCPQAIYCDLCGEHGVECDVCAKTCFACSEKCLACTKTA